MFYTIFSSTYSAVIQVEPSHEVFHLERLKMAARINNQNMKKTVILTKNLHKNNLPKLTGGGGTPRDSLVVSTSSFEISTT